VSPNERVARTRAEAFRSDHGLADRPLGDLFELAHTALGVDALVIPADDAEHGLSMLDPATGRVVIVAAATPHPMRQRSSVAHEIGHVVADDLLADNPPTPGTRSPAEIQADAFARHLLLPVSALQARFGSVPAGVGRADLADVVQEFEVSPHLAAIQLREAGLIDAETLSDWSALSAGSLAARYGWLSQYQLMSAASARPRAPQTLMRRAVEGYRRGVVGIAELSTWYDLAPEQLMEQLGPPDPRGDATVAPADGDLEDGFDDLDEDAPLFPADVGRRPAPAS
jgi:Zn-dependent peptidase ImmA (M78 family)